MELTLCIYEILFVASAGGEDEGVSGVKREILDLLRKNS